MISVARRSIPRSLATARRFAAARRRRPTAVSTKFEKALEQQQQELRLTQPDRGGLHQAFAPTEANFDDYLSKASLSPWVPVPDPVARKMLEISKAGPDDVHVELGSGDGRMNFHALDPPFSVQKSTGLDIAEQLVRVANERLSKRHPKPDNLEFRVEDLMKGDSLHATLQDATLITMYFVQDALKKLKPKLEHALGDRKGVRIVCCGYEMPGWEPRWAEVILDLPVYMYTYNTPLEELPKLTAEERAQIMAVMEPSPQPMESLEEEVFRTNSADDDVEEIEVPLFDPNEMIDGHWDDFDEEEEEDDLDGNPAISKWRKPE